MLARPLYLLILCGLLLTAPTLGFEVANVKVIPQALRPDAALIMWDTDPYTSGRVEYGISAAYGQTSYTNTRARTHLIDVRGLAPAMAYHYRVISTTPEGETAISADQTFTTPLERANTVTLAGGYLATPMTLNQANTRYVLQNDATAETGAFVINANDITLDLNGHTVTYDTYQNFPRPLGLPNPGFEQGAGDVPSDWDISRAPHAKRWRTSRRALLDGWYLEIEEPPDSGEEIVSGWAWLPTSTAAAAMFIPSFQAGDWYCAVPPPCYAPILNISVEREDGVLVYSWAGNVSYPNENIFTTGPTASQYRVHWIVQEWRGPANKWHHNMSFDQLDLRPRNNWGVYLYARSNILVRNGRILQGRGNSTRGHAVYSSGSSLIIDSIRALAAGMEAAGFYLNYAKSTAILHSEAESDSPSVFNRHQLSAPVMIPNTIAGFSGGVFFNNTVRSGKAWGGIYLSHTRNFDSLIAYNNVTSNSVITNHHAINLYNANGTRVFNNLIVADPGEGLQVVGGNISVHDNNISLLSQAPNPEYGKYAKDGIRLKDWVGTCAGNRVDGNAILGIGDFDEYYLEGYPDNGTLVVGLAIGCHGEGNVVSNNTVSVRLVDAGNVAVGLEPASWRANTRYINNTLESNSVNIMLGSYGSYSAVMINSTLLSNTLIKGQNSINYYTLSSGTSGGSRVSNIHLIDTALLSGASLNLSSVWMGNLPTAYEYFVDWHLDLEVVDPLGAPVDGAQIAIYDARGGPVFAGATDAAGRTGRLTLTEARFYGGPRQGQPSVEARTPHTVQVSKDGFTTLTQAVTMDASKTLQLQLVPGESCPVPQNQPPCDCVTLLEIQGAVSAWFRGSLRMSDLFSLLRAWRGNPGC